MWAMQGPVRMGSWLLHNYVENLFSFPQTPRG